MNPSFFLKFVFFVSLSLFFLFPDPSTAGCEWGEHPVSLEAINKPVRDILRDIEKQTNYAIEVQDDAVLDSTKTIVLKQAPLNQALSRLLKELNFSVICDNEQKKLNLVFLDKKTAPSSMTATMEIDETGEGGMNDVSVAFAEYRNNPAAELIPEDQDETIMAGASSAFEEFTNSPTPSSQEPQEQDETIMAGASAALEEFMSPAKTSAKEAEPPEQDETIMAGASNAFEEFTNSPSPPSQEQDETIMAGASNAFAEYQRLNR
ncbi:MAG: hypothetical protein RBR09_13600 [Desulfobulbaceae bacterium]|jgi:hypothetical protein|nr:hypothetical protein [Desulfobulbaceae bacterium]